MSKGSHVNLIKESPWLGRLFVIWLALSILLGWFSLFFTYPPQLGLQVYSNYKPHVENYNLLCASLMFSIVLTPVFYTLIWKYGFIKIRLKSMSMRIVFFLLALVFLLLGFGAFEIKGNQKLSHVLMLIVNHLDWFGALMISFFCLFAAVFLSISAIKSERRLDPQ